MYLRGSTFFGREVVVRPNSIKEIGWTGRVSVMHGGYSLWFPGEDIQRRVRVLETVAMRVDVFGIRRMKGSEDMR